MDSLPLDLDKIKLVLFNQGYEYVEPVGEGGYGSCFRVFSHKYNQSFVCKTMHQQFSFEQELNALLQLNHQNVIKLYKYFHEFDTYFLILEDCTGGNIFDYISKNYAKDSDILKFTSELIDALSFLHMKGVAHLDIKPANVLLDKYGRIKLADFGLARKNHGNCCQFSGTRCFMAPEVVQKKPYDSFKADVWSLGMTLYFMAYRCLPFSNKSQWSHFVEYGVFKMPKFISAEFRDVLKHCLQPNPDKRATMQQLRDIFKFPRRPSQPNFIVPKPRMFMRAHVPQQLSFGKLNFGMIPTSTSQLKFPIADIPMNDDND